jgi:hypothetical protein
MGLRLKLSRARKIALLTLFIFALLATAFPAQATGYWRVNVLVAYDEEWRAIANNKYWYSPDYLARLLIYLVNYRFWTFNIEFYIMSFVSWDSDDAPINAHIMLWEAIEETGFQSGMTYGGYVVHVLVAFTGQDIPVFLGYNDPQWGAVLIQHCYPSGVGQATDNVLQHELSNLYDAPDHYQDDLDCVMNEFPEPIGFPYDDVPTALVTENWCSDCYTTIMNHRDNWGYWRAGGGGGMWIKDMAW